MKATAYYTCKNCGKTVEKKASEHDVPECCDKPMSEDVDACELSATAEHARMDKSDDPCDDGRSG